MDVVLGDRIRRLRESLGYSQAELARVAGISLGALKKYEGDKRAPGADAIIGLCKAGANLNWLATGEGQILWKDVASARHGLNTDLLTDIIGAIEQVLDENDLEMLPRKKAEVIVGVYELLQDSEAKVSPATILRLVKSAA